MEPFEIMVSESQERMLCVVEPYERRCGARRLRQVGGACQRGRRGDGHGTHSAILRDGEIVGELPVALLVDDCPLYELAPERPAVPLYDGGEQQVADRARPAEVLMALLASANIGSRRAVFEQYDPVVQSRTVRRPEQADAAVLVLPVLAADTGAGGDPIPGSRSR